MFGDNILILTGKKLNGNNEGRCCVGTGNHYNIEAVDGKSPLTGENINFTAADLTLKPYYRVSIVCRRKNRNSTTFF
jgi:hypothetical protein